MAIIITSSMATVHKNFVWLDSCNFIMPDNLHTRRTLEWRRGSRATLTLLHNSLLTGSLCAKYSLQAIFRPFSVLKKKRKILMKGSLKIRVLFPKIIHKGGVPIIKMEMEDILVIITLLLNGLKCILRSELCSISPDSRVKVNNFTVHWILEFALQHLSCNCLFILQLTIGVCKLLSKRIHCNTNVCWWW